MSVQRLVDEFQAQDVGAFMVVRHGLKHINVAQWVEGNGLWVVLPEGQALLDEKDGVVVESVTAGVEEKPTRKKSAKNAFANALDGDEA